MAPAVKKGGKINFYKVVGTKEPKGTGKDAAVAVAVNEGNKGLNSIGLTLNSIAESMKGIKSVMLGDLEDAKKQPKFDAKYNDPKANKQQKSFVQAIADSPKSSLGLLGILGEILKMAIVIPVLKWISKKENQKKVKSIIEVISKVVKFIFSVAKFGVVNAIEGLYKLLSDETSWWEKLLGFGQALLGIGTLILGIRWLKNPLKIVTDFAGVLKFLANNLLDAKKKLSRRSRRRGGGLGKTLAIAGTAFTVGAVTGSVMSGGDKDKDDGGDSPPPKKAQGGKLPEAATGGFIDGPQSGYRVSLDGGRSTSFIGHGREYVARKSNGGAFVIPLNTPATKTQPHLTQKRIGEAKSQGYRIPGFSSGGKAPGSKQKGGGKDSKKGNASGISRFNKMMGKATSFLGAIGKKTMKPVMNAAKSVYRAPGWMGFAQGGSVRDKYKNGEVPRSEMKQVTGYAGYGAAGKGILHNSVADKFQSMLDAAKKDGHPLGINDTYRTYEDQVYMKQTKGRLAATPGTSNHGYGLAADLNYFDGGYKWLWSNADKFGFRPLSGWGLSPNTPDKAEAWHWENLDGSGTADPNVQTEPAGDADDAGQQPVNAPAQGYGKLLDLIGKYESDSSGGYDAVNQIGTSGGHGVKGYAGPFSKMKQHGGKKLTSLTVAEVMQLQSGWDGGMSDEEWIKKGKLHAVGRYQIIGPTLSSLVNKGIVSKSDKFDEATQNKLGIALVKGRGNDPAALQQEWIGLQKASTQDIAAAIQAGGDTTSGGHASVGGRIKPAGGAQTPPGSSAGGEGANEAAKIVLGGTTQVTSGTGKPNYNRVSSSDLPEQAIARTARGSGSVMTDATKERNDARSKISEKTQSMMNEVITKVSAANAQNAQVVKQAQQGVQQAAQQGGGGGQQQMMPSGGKPKESAASRLGSQINPLKQLLR
tara:strand:+ start:469 stop:3243 length:2775 start_codon:yes stop_codon:yes gene_type:complete